MGKKKDVDMMILGLTKSRLFSMLSCDGSVLKFFGRSVVGYLNFGLVGSWFLGFKFSVNLVVKFSGLVGRSVG